jgi:hypothetical protein
MLSARMSVEIVPQLDLGNPLERESICVSLSFQKSQETRFLSTSKLAGSVFVTILCQRSHRSQVPTRPSHSFAVPPFWATICRAFELSIRQADRVAGSDWKAKIENEPATSGAPGSAQSESMLTASTSSDCVRGAVMVHSDARPTLKNRLREKRSVKREACPEGAVWEGGESIRNLEVGLDLDVSHPTPPVFLFPILFLDSYYLFLRMSP